MKGKERNVWTQEDKDREEKTGVGGKKRKKGEEKFRVKG